MKYITNNMYLIWFINQLRSWYMVLRRCGVRVACPFCWTEWKLGALTFLDVPEWTLEETYVFLKLIRYISSIENVSANVPSKKHSKLVRKIKRIMLGLDISFHFGLLIQVSDPLYIEKLLYILYCTMNNTRIMMCSLATHGMSSNFLK